MNCCCFRKSHRSWKVGRDSIACVEIIRSYASRTSSSDDINDRLVSSLSCTPLDDEEEGNIEYLFANCDGTNGIVDYAITCIYMCNIQAKHEMSTMQRELSIESISLLNRYEISRLQM